MPGDSNGGGPESGPRPDVFVSYAWDDDEPVIKSHDGWVTSFQHAFRAQLRQLLRGTNVWRDQQNIRGNHDFQELLEQELRKVPLLVSILSPNYVESKWCLWELETFWKALEETGGAKVGGRGRVFRVVKRPHGKVAAEHSQVLGELGERFTGYEFFTRDPKVDRVRELDPAYEEYQLQFHQRVDDLAQDAVAVLEAMRGESGAVAGAGVYLAETTSDLRSARIELRRSLMDHGYAVYPDGPLPTSKDEIDKVVRQALAQCRLSIHLVGGNRGAVPEGSRRGTVELQHELAREHAGGGKLARLIWIPDDLDPSTVEPEQAELIARLRDKEQLGPHDDLLESTIERLKTIMHERLGALLVKQTVVYLAATTHDLRDHRAAVLRELERHGYTVLPDGPPSLLAGELEETVRKQLARSSVFVHLVGTQYGVVPEGTERSIQQIEHELAGERQAAGEALVRWAWFTQGSPADPRHSKLVERLRADTALRVLEPAAADPQGIANDVRERLDVAERERAVEAPGKEPPPGARPARVYVVWDQADTGDEDLKALRQHLHESGLEVLTPLFEGDATDIREEHEENLEICDGLLLYYGQAKQPWLRRKLRELRKRPAAPRAAVIWVAGPEREDKQELSLHEAEVVRPAGAFDPAALRDFVARLKGPPAGGD